MFSANFNNDLLVQKIEQFRPFFYGAARRFSIPVLADEDSLVESCCLLVAELMEEHPDLDPLSDDFDALLRTAVYNRVISEVRPYLTQKRDYHLQSSGNREIATDDGNASQVFDLINPEECPLRGLFWWTNANIPPHVRLQLEEQCKLVEEKLSDDAMLLWRLIRDDPPALWESLDLYNELYFECEDGVFRQHEMKYAEPTYAVMAFHLDWSIRKMRWHLGVIRERVLEIFGEAVVERALGLSIVRDADGYITLGEPPDSSWYQHTLAENVTVWYGEFELVGKKDVLDIGDGLLLLYGRGESKTYCIKFEWLDYTWGECRGCNGVLYRW